MTLKTLWGALQHAAIFYKLLGILFLAIPFALIALVEIINAHVSVTLQLHERLSWSSLKVRHINGFCQRLSIF